MKKMIIRGLALLLACTIVLSFVVTAFAAETFNAGVTIEEKDDGIYVTVREDNAEFLAQNKPKLSIPVPYECAMVWFDNQETASVVANGMVTFTVAAPGTYIIYGQAVAQCAQTVYVKLEDALAAAAENTENSGVTLLANIEIAKDRTLVIPGGVQLIVGYGSALTNNGKIIVYGELRVEGGTLVNNGQILCNTHTDGDDNGICDICGASVNVVLNGYTASLEGNVQMNFHVTLDEKVQNDPTAKMVFNLPNGTQTTVSVAEAGGEQSVFSCEVAAKEMSAPITAQIVTDGGNNSLVYTYSVKEYADYMLANPDLYADEQEIVKAMLTYGSYAQIHFGYNQANLAYENLNVSNVTAETLSGYANSVQQGTSKVRLAGSSLLLKSNTVLRLFFKVDDSAKNSVTFTYNGETLPTKVISGYYTVDITGIAAQNLTDDVTVEVSDGSETADVSYNVMSYCYNVLANPDSYDESHQNIVRALYAYGDAAKNYFANKGADA